MSLEDFKEVCADYAWEKKLDTMLQTAEYLAEASRTVAVERINRNWNGIEYQERKCAEMRDRLAWLRNQIVEEIKDIEDRLSAAEEYLMESEEYEDVYDEEFED